MPLVPVDRYLQSKRLVAISLATHSPAAVNRGVTAVSAMWWRKTAGVPSLHLGSLSQRTVEPVTDVTQFAAIYDGVSPTCTASWDGTRYWTWGDPSNLGATPPKHVTDLYSQLKDIKDPPVLDGYDAWWKTVPLEFGWRPAGWGGVREGDTIGVIRDWGTMEATGEMRHVTYLGRNTAHLPGEDPDRRYVQSFDRWSDSWPLDNRQHPYLEGRS